MTPLYRQIVDNIIKQIENNEYLPNEKLPSERDLAELYGVNRMTVKKAMDMLVEMEYLYRDVGRGTFVKNRMTMKKAMNMLADKGYFNQNTGQIFFTKETKSKQLLYPAGFLPYDGGISVQKTSSEIRHSSKVIFSGFLRDWPAMCARLRLGPSLPCTSFVMATVSPWEWSTATFRRPILKMRKSKSSTRCLCMTT